MKECTFRTSTERGAQSSGKVDEFSRNRGGALFLEEWCPGDAFSEPESKRSTMFSGPREKVERSGGGSCDAGTADAAADARALFESDRCGDETVTFSTRV